MEDLIILLKYLFLGIFQGITEPIPVSSSGHLILLQELIGVELGGLTFEVIVNFASLIAVLMIYRDSVSKLFLGATHYLIRRQKKDQEDFRFVMYLIIGTVPAVIIGLLLGDKIAEHLTGVKVIGATLLVTGIALWLIRNLRGRKNDSDLSIKDAVIVGLAQAVALIPGISRSGATIVAAMALGMKQETALKFSFLLYIPVSVGGIVLAISDLLKMPNITDLLVPYLIAFVGSLVASYFSLRWFMGIMARGNLVYFSVYCFVVGTLAILVF
ncbi:undecaprenyl-diphosphate phosphatase [Anaerobacillus isosaccharinicus]|uniref:Undecaprenyl-diphosphatase n=1 Tax=Anaerobacillus isosaccharinicus TaxID=1532552 RepID=A0A1S2L181_9BACI|nr:undecaprenyl-diphosphate phosphatase [Anaerobacillus isosaccharinicus]MBA5588278.1 undecaprenyl-diphosphate phosphatase [Anaerobacillus isosaccharinicus]QOY38283.1 undecaprenyl-diphosphate phosphatase [Anaerobacillus isosaccharinicus]